MTSVASAVTRLRVSSVLPAGKGFYLAARRQLSLLTNSGRPDGPMAPVGRIFVRQDNRQRRNLIPAYQEQ